MFRTTKAVYLFVLLIFFVPNMAYALEMEADTGIVPVTREKLQEEVERSEVQEKLPEKVAETSKNPERLPKAVETFKESDYLLELPVIQTGDSLDITLKEAISEALDKNHDIVIEKITTDISQTLIQKEEGSFDPTIKVELTKSRSRAVDATNAHTLTAAAKGATEISKKFITGTTLALNYDTTDNSEGSTGGRFTSNLKASITQNLLKYFGVDINKAKIIIAQKGLDKAKADYRQKIVETIADVQSAYWDLYKSRETLVVREETFKQSKALFTKKKIEAGLGAIASIDLVEIESDVATKITEYTEALKEFRDNEIKLRALLAMPMNFEPGSRLLKPATSPVLRTLKMDYEQVLNGMLVRHQGYQSILKNKEAKEIEVDYYRNQLLPSLQAKLSYGLQNQNRTWDHSAGIGGGGGNYEMGLSLSIPIGNNSAKSTLKKNMLELKKLFAQLNQKKDEIRKEIKSALVEVEQAGILVQSAKIDVIIKGKNFAASEKKLQYGTGTLRGLLDRQTEKATAQLKLIQSQIDYQKAVVNFYKAQGVIDPDLKIEISASQSQKS